MINRPPPAGTICQPDVVPFAEPALAAAARAKRSADRTLVPRRSARRSPADLSRTESVRHLPGSVGRRSDSGDAAAHLEAERALAEEFQRAYDHQPEAEQERLELAAAMALTARRILDEERG